MPQSFDYHRADTLEQACQLMAQLPQAAVVAGGTDLLIDVETGLRTAENVISLKDIAELKQIAETDSHVTIGSGCTARMVEQSSIVRKCLPELAGMVVLFASPQIRSRATIAGNICSAVACGDFPVILTALGAELELVSQNDKRKIAISEFFLANRKTARQPDEILARIVIPKKPANGAAAYQKSRRRASNSLALASVAVYLEIENDKCTAARIVMGSVGPTPISADKAVATLIGRNLNEKNVTAAADAARREAMPITDIRGTEDYRRELTFVLTQRALREAAENINRTS